MATKFSTFSFFVALLLLGNLFLVSNARKLREVTRSKHGGDVKVNFIKARLKLAELPTFPPLPPFPSSLPPFPFAPPFVMPDLPPMPTLPLFPPFPPFDSFPNPFISPTPL
ncbi:hypothetical protein QJS10_CPB21g01007 [Acorus calamus]|uniref:Uncharacterized protein n=1 Tax=Acorus calamus TaxID=4465 RepID=A0AAV9C5W1_ACOCL|nr:hypothetical protein QJS10_CPB21g01007 [Acorus calamus]